MSDNTKYKLSKRHLAARERAEEAGTNKARYFFGFIQDPVFGPLYFPEERVPLHFPEEGEPVAKGKGKGKGKEKAKEKADSTGGSS